PWPTGRDSKTGNQTNHPALRHLPWPAMSILEEMPQTCIRSHARTRKRLQAAAMAARLESSGR
ncbi:MAG: hypothetical protein D6725_07665, partial [Planctomycetota bacterium]